MIRYRLMGMRKSIYMMALAASVWMLPACSNEDFVTDSVTESGSHFVPGDSEVEIALGTLTQGNIAVDKRASLDGNADMTDLGIFCLARDKQDVNTEAYDINWFTDDENNWSGCIMKNVKAVKNDVSVSWSDPEEHYYYPISQFYCYDFFAYYPYVEDGGNIHVNNNKVTVDYQLDGKMDIIWGRATSSEKYAYSATYFRQPGNQERFPMLDLKHVLTRLKFQVVPGASVEGGDEVSPAMADYAVAQVKILDAKASATMTVADFNRINELDETNCLEAGWDVADFELCKADGEPMDTTMVGTDMDVNTPLGESIMLLPDSSYTVRVSLVNVRTGDSFVTEHPLKLTQSSSFRAGYTYTVTITAHEPKEVQLQANLNPWQETEDNPSVSL